MKLIRRQLKQTILFMGTLITISLIQTAYPHFFDDQNIEPTNQYRYHSVESMINEQNLELWFPPFNPETITFLHDGFSFDKNYIYVRDFKRYPYQDPAEIKIREKQFLKEIIDYTGIDSSIIDFDSLTILSALGYFYQDKNNTYSQDTILEVDPVSFEVVSRYFAKDKHQVYFLKEAFKGSDPKTFTAVDAYFTHDKYGVYQLDRYIEEISRSNPLSFHHIDSNYYADQDHVYFRYIMQGFEIIEKADPKTFTPLNDRYAIDKERVYLFTAPLADVDHATFEALDRPFARDNQNLYYNGTAITNANRISYRSLKYAYPEEKRRAFEAFRNVSQSYGDHSHYSTDDHHGYYSSDHNNAESPRDSKLTIMDNNVDTQSLKELDIEFAADSFQFYYLGETVESPHFDHTSLESLGPFTGLFRDKNHVYQYQHQDKKIIILENIDPTSVQYYNSSHYLRDKTQIYYMGSPFKEADIETFQNHLRDPHKARDQYHCYDKAEIIEC